MIRGQYGNNLHPPRRALINAMVAAAAWLAIVLPAALILGLLS